MSRPANHAASVPLIDLGRVLASQLIVWHHLTIYSPLQAQLDPLAPSLWSWLADPARMAVQIFLVMGGYLAAMQWLPHPDAGDRLPPAALPRALWQRYLRLVPACIVALGAAVLSAELARWLTGDPNLPPTPSWSQWLINLLLLQDILGQDALNAGLWYVAIDLQLFGLVLLIVALRHHAAWRGGLTLGLVLGLTVASLFGFNLRHELDAWALYFFGSYGLGMLAAWVRNARHRRHAWLGQAFLAGVVLMALNLAWRDRLVVAGVTALCLANPWLNGPLWSRLAQWGPLPWLARTSYAVFLAHYPVCVLTGAVVSAFWPDTAVFSALGLLVTWALALLAGWALHVGVEQQVKSWGRAPARPQTQALPATH